MFTTQKQDQIAVPLPFGHDEVRTWRRVMMELYAPYFLVSYIIQDGGIRFGQTMLFHFAQDLISFFNAAQEQPGIQIRQIALLSPSTMDSTNGWALETLTEIWCATHPKGQYPVLSYVTDAGRRYVDKDDDAELEPLFTRLLYVRADFKSAAN